MDKKITLDIDLSKYDKKELFAVWEVFNRIYFTSKSMLSKEITTNINFLLDAEYIRREGSDCLRQAKIEIVEKVVKDPEMKMMFMNLNELSIKITEEYLKNLGDTSKEN